MNDPDSLDAHERHLGERLDRAVGGLRAPDVVHGAMARGRRQRTRRRLAYGAGGIAAVTALVLAVPTFAGEQEPPAPTVAADPTGTSSASAAPGTGGSEDSPCGESATGWWSKSSVQIRTELAAGLPAGTRVGETNDDATGVWGGNLVTGSDADFASLTLLPPPGTPGGRLSLDELGAGGPCVGGSNEPMQAVKPCDELTGYVSCEEIRAEGELVGVVTEKVEQTVVDGQDQPTDKTYVLATVAGPEGGHVELYVAEGTRADRPDTVHRADDVPALTVGQVRDIVSDPVWTS